MKFQQKGCSRVKLLRHLENVIMKEYAVKFCIGLSRSGYESVTNYHLYTTCAHNNFMLSIKMNPFTCFTDKSPSAGSRQFKGVYNIVTQVLQVLKLDFYSC